jgi:hypothetical protein
MVTLPVVNPVPGKRRLDGCFAFSQRLLLGRLLGAEQTDRDQVERADEAVDDPESRRKRRQLPALRSSR